MVSYDKLINTPRSVYTQSVEDTCCKDIDFQRNPTPNVTDSFPSLNISLQTPKTDSPKYKSSLRDSSQVSLEQVLAMETYFINKIYELKNEICCLKNQLEDGEKNPDNISMVSFYKSEIFLSKNQN